MYCLLFTATTSTVKNKGGGVQWQTENVQGTGYKVKSKKGRKGN